MSIKELIKEYDMWHEKQMEVLKEHKKGLMQHLFPSLHEIK